MRVLLLGTAGDMARAPLSAYDEAWACNDHYRIMEPWDQRAVTRWWELHDVDSVITRARRPVGHCRSLAALRVPVYTCYPDAQGWIDAREGYPELDIRPFPLAKAIQAGKDYFACTFSYQIALALSEGATGIGMYGVALTTAREVTVERPCVEWWLGWAAGRGVDVMIYNPSRYGLGRQPWRYALDDVEERAFAYESVANLTRSLPAWLRQEAGRLRRTGRAHVPRLGAWRARWSARQAQSVTR